MALVYVANMNYYGGNYLMHARTKGSKNGISHTPGYVAVGDLAEGRFVNGRYVYDNVKTNGPKTLIKRDVKKNGGYANYMVGRASSQVRSGNYGSAAKSFGAAAKSTARSAYKNVSSAANTAYKNVSSAANTAYKNVGGAANKTYNNVNNWVTGDYARNQLSIARNAGDKESIAYWEKEYSKTLPGIIDNVKNVGANAWNTVKTNARSIIEKGSKFLSEFITGRNAKARLALAKEDNNQAGIEYWQKQYDKTLSGMATKAWESVKRAGKQAMEWGKPLVEKAVGVAKGARIAGIRAGDFITGKNASARLALATEDNNATGVEHWQKEYNSNTLPGIINNVGKAVGGKVTSFGQAIANPDGTFQTFLRDASGKTYTVVTDIGGNIISLFGGTPTNKTGNSVKKVPYNEPR